MKKQMLFVWWVTLMVIATLLPAESRAQSATPPARQFAVQVQGLTSEDRDAVQAQLRGRQDVRLVYACVPAGILVFEGDANSTRLQAKQRALPLLQARIAGKHSTDLDHGIAQAEAACAQLRNQ